MYTYYPKFYFLVLVISVILFTAICVVPCSADANQLQVTVTATPASVSAGSSTQILVTATYYGQPISDATVVATTNTGSATLTPSSGQTDSSGSASFRLDTASSTSGTVRVSASVTKQTIDAYYAGNGYVDIPVQPVVIVPVEPVVIVPVEPVVIVPVEPVVIVPVEPVVLVSTTTPIPQPYQPPAAPPYQPPPAPPYQPYQPPAPQQPQQPLPAGAQAPVAVISVDNYAGNMPLTVTFDGQQSYAPGGSIVTYAWDFGDGTTGTGYIAQHTYSAPGTFIASLIVTDNNGLPSNPATTQIQGGVQVQQQQPVYHPPQQQQVYQPPPQPVNKQPVAPMTVINPAEACDDGNKCTINDYYDCSRKCVAGRVLNCDDSSPDTVDSCDPAIGCIHKNLADITASKMSQPQCGGYTNYIHIQNFEINKGRELQVPVMACGVQDLSKIVLNIDYNYNAHTANEKQDYRNVLKFKNAEKDSLNENAIVQSTQSHISDSLHSSDRVTISISSSPSTSGSGPLAMLTFDVIGDTNNITFITPRVVTATDGWNNPIPFTTLGGTVIVKMPLQGNWYGNGRITTKDVLVAQQMASGKIPSDRLLDMNNDTRVDAADVAVLQQIASGERMPGYEQVPAKIPVNVSKRLDAIERKIDSEAKIAGIAGKIEKIQRSFDVDLTAKPAGVKKVVSSSSVGGGSSQIPSSRRLAQLPNNKLLSLPKVKNPSTSCLPPMITAVKSGKNVIERAYMPDDLDSVAEDSAATIEGLNLGICTEKDCGIYLEYPESADVEFATVHEINGRLPNLSRLDLLPYTGSWETTPYSQGSWFDQGIVVKIPPIPRESEMVVSGSRYATLVVPIFDQAGKNPCIKWVNYDPLTHRGGYCDTRANQTVIRYPVWLYVDMAGIDEIHSNPDYSNSLKANPILRGSTGIIPMYEGPEYYYSGPIIVSGGDLVITGENFGDKKGNIKIVFPDPLIPFVQDSLDEYKWVPDYQHKKSELPLTDYITNWSDSEIRLSVPKVAGSYDVTGGYLYIQKDGANPNLWSWIPVSFSPKWVWKQISGKKFFKLDDDYWKRAKVDVVSNVLVVTHTPDCECTADLWDICKMTRSGDWGFDTLFKQKPLPPNVKLIFFSFHYQGWNTDWGKNIEIGYDYLSEWYNDPEIAFLKTIAVDIAMFFDPGMGRYGVSAYGPTPSLSPEAPVNPDQPWFVEQHLLRPTDPAINIEWHNSCFYMADYAGEPVVYTTTFFVRAPEDVDVGD